MTVTLPHNLIRDIDRGGQDRSLFAAEAIRNELNRRRDQELLVSLRNPHPESIVGVVHGFDEWLTSIPQEDVEDLYDPNAGTAIRWIPNEGWREEADSYLSPK